MNDLHVYFSCSSFRDWPAEETNHSRKVIEAAYARSNLFERRWTLMEQWGRYLAQGTTAKDSERERQRGSRSA